MSELLSVRALRIESRLRGGRQTIVSGIDLDVERGETVGIVGESGSGKSLSARAILGLLPPGLSALGSIRFKGDELLGLPERALRRYRGRGISLLFQDPYTLLNPLVRVGRQITETVEARGTARRADAARRLAEVGIDAAEVARKYPFQLSGGMRQRVAIAAALASDPELIVADEPSTALDVTTQKEILALLRSTQERRGMGLILITHDLRVAFSMCERVYVLYAGRVLETAPAPALERTPLHPYSLALLLSEPPVDRRVEELASVEGSVPRPDDVGDRCPFVARCEWSRPVCAAGAVTLMGVGDNRASACVRIDEIRDELVSRREEAQRSTPVRPVRTGPASLVATEGLVKRFGSKTAVAGVSLELHPGESVGLVGESGSGKTTLARCLLGLEQPDAGTIVIDGIDASDYGRVRVADRRRLRRTIQMIFQDPYSSLNPSRSVGATLKEALAVAPAERRETVGGLLARVGLPADYARRKPAALSGGERQRVAIARALATRPEVIVCDEPVSSLDVSVQAQILNLFQKIGESLAISYLFITHDLAVVRQVVERVYVLYRGQVVEHGPIDGVLDEPKHPYTRRLVASVPRSDPDWLSSSLPLEPSDSGTRT